MAAGLAFLASQSMQMAMLKRVNIERGCRYRTLACGDRAVITTIRIEA
jgi:hypothetical protein